MANRNFNQFRKVLQKETCDIFVKLNAGTAAVTLDTALSKGVYSATRTGTGTYTIVFGSNPNGVPQYDTYYKFLNAGVVGVGATAPAFKTIHVASNDIATSASLSVVLTDATGTAVDPASGSFVYFDFTFANSTAP